MKYILFISVLWGLFSCSSNRVQDKFQEKKVVPNPTGITTVWVKESESNFEALLATDHLYYLKHMSPDYDNHGKDFWQSGDTTKKDGITRIYRNGACQYNEESSKLGYCREQQTHTIKDAINKVINFTGTGSGYAANIDYVYNEKGDLIEYRDSNKVFYLKYDSQNNLIEVIGNEISFGISKEIIRIRFTPISNK